MVRLQFAILALAMAVCGLVRAQEPAADVETLPIEAAMVRVVARCEKSVVAIARVRREQPGESFPFEARPDPFGRGVAPLMPAQPTDPDFIPNEYAAGVVVDPRGLILTACHVLAEASDYYVTTADHRVYKAVVKAADPRSDLAVLAVDAAELTSIPFGDGASAKKGQIVVALGNPYAMARDGQASASWGIVANLARKAPATPTESDPAGRPTLHHYGTLLQTDARLVIGTSGGPLLNLRGEMIGLCVALAAAPGHESAGGYAIPVDATFRRALDTLKLGREVEYGFLGIQPTNLRTREILAGMQGMRVGQVLSGTPAARAGLKANDIIASVDGTPIHDADGLVLNVGKLPPASVARLAVVRDGRPRTIDVTLTKYAVRGPKVVTVEEPAWRGLRVEYTTAVVDEDGRARTGMAFDDNAVVVVKSAEGSPAWRAGLRPGTLITHVDGTTVRTPGEFAAAVAQSSGPVPLRVAGDEKNPVRIVPER